IVGAASLAIGLWVILDDASLFNILREVLQLNLLGSDILRESSLIMVTAGAALIMLAGIGVMGALALSSCLLSFYAVVLVMLMTLESAVVVLVLVFRSELESKASDMFNQRLKTTYGDSIDDSRGPFTRTFNALQTKLSCCGWTGPEDFAHVDHHHWNTTLDNGLTRRVPDQCCGTQHSDDNSTDTVQECVSQPYNSSKINQQGCYDAVKKIIDGYQWSIFGIAVFLLLFQFVVMILTLASIVHNGKVKYEMREFGGVEPMELHQQQQS
ncbi:hypothetical protein EGW08_017857, partial [Elysia chlorotica]